MVELTHYEMLDLAHSHMNAAVIDLNRALALGSAYLVVAYKAGKQLTRFQVTIINIGFVVFAGQAMLGVMGELDASQAFRNAVWGEERMEHVINQLHFMFFWVGAPLAIGSIIACLAFMWRVRHPKAD
ncbi:hypothetical protein [Marinobacter alexandrii]|uniref:hypothetical protein n=1 Tax=Marinobacter alexandrii TaxID=2570351 RepID=UPI003297AFD3